MKNMRQHKVYFYPKPTPDDTIETLYDKTEKCLLCVVDVIVNELGGQPKSALMLCCIAARVGLMGDGTLKEEIREICFSLINKIFKGVDPVFLEDFIVAPIDETCYELLTSTYKMDSGLGDFLIGLIKCFGYINGGLDNAISDRLSEIAQNK